MDCSFFVLVLHGYRERKKLLQTGRNKKSAQIVPTTTNSSYKCVNAQLLFIYSFHM